MTQTQQDKAKAKSIDKLYKIAKDQAVDSLGGARAYAIVGPSIRRMAVGAAILDLVITQDSSISAETVRSLTEALHLRMVEDGEVDFL